MYTLKDIRERRAKRKQREADILISKHRLNNPRAFKEMDAINRPSSSKFPSQREQRQEAKKSNRITLICKTCGARVSKPGVWFMRRAKIYDMKKDVSALLDFNPYTPQGEMEKMFPLCGNCRSVSWKKLRYLDRKEERQMVSVLLQGDAFNPNPMGAIISGKKLFKSERNV